MLTSSVPPKPKRPVGRPKGSGPKQQAARDKSMVAVKKGHVGRPRNYPMFGMTKSPQKSMFSALLHTGLSYRGGSHEASVSSPALNSATSTPRCSTRKSANELPSPETPSATAPSTPTTVQPDLPQGEDLLLPPADLQYLVIPEEDPYCVINDKDSDEGSDNNDEDEDSQLLEDVIGDEDEDEDEDEVAPKSKFSSPWPLPIWLKTAFELRVEELSHRGSDGLPPLYRDHQTFWFPRPATYFLLQNSSPSPQHLYQYDLFLWDPMSLLPHGIPCPNSGCRARLWRLGPIPRPRRVVDINGTFWIIGYRYRCSKCSKPNNVTFHSWDPRILSVLPRHLTAEFPARQSFCSGISVDALMLM